MFEIEIEKSFSAAHCLRNYPGDCARLHGHNWLVRVCVRTQELDTIGIALDFRKLKKDVQIVLDEFDHEDLNELPMFQNCNPTSEALARCIYKTLADKINAPGVKIHCVTVCESPGTAARYFEEG